tara:strand:- start:321 stop:443 length:123 start_codon:yes stop_codon:yes gene_type:complete
MGIHLKIMGGDLSIEMVVTEIHTPASVLVSMPLEVEEEEV